MRPTISISPSRQAIHANIQLPLSKSISNRVALLYALSGKDVSQLKLSDAEDTSILLRALKSNSAMIDVQDAGTVMRFMLAYAALRGRPCILQGTSRMHARPIAPLVDALRALGAKVTYREKEGFPPLELFSGRLVTPPTPLVIKANVSSQFISALLMIAPALPQGLTIALDGESVSSKYIDMTIACMAAFGISVNKDDFQYHIPPQVYLPKEPITVEPDWSSAAFFYSLCALMPNSTIRFPGLSLHSIQGDAVLPDLYKSLGVETREESGGITILNTGQVATTQHTFHFIGCPDLAQPYIFTCAALGHSCIATGLYTLPGKETHRIAALAETLEMMGLTVSTDLATTIKSEGKASWDTHHVFDTFGDHRMAMSLAVLGAVAPIRLDDATVVKKSYPRFWEAITASGLLLDT